MMNDTVLLLDALQFALRGLDNLEVVRAGHIRNALRDAKGRLARSPVDAAAGHYEAPRVSSEALSYVYVGVDSGTGARLYRAVIPLTPNGSDLGVLRQNVENASPYNTDKRTMLEIAQALLIRELELRLQGIRGATE